MSLVQTLRTMTDTTAAPHSLRSWSAACAYLFNSIVQPEGRKD